MADQPAQTQAQNNSSTQSNPGSTLEAVREAAKAAAELELRKAQIQHDAALAKADRDRYAAEKAASAAKESRQALDQVTQQAVGSAKGRLDSAAEAANRANEALANAKKEFDEQQKTLANKEALIEKAEQAQQEALGKLEIAKAQARLDKSGAAVTLANAIDIKNDAIKQAEADFEKAIN